jgi:hypothetical protein
MLDDRQVVDPVLVHRARVAGLPAQLIHGDGGCWYAAVSRGSRDGRIAQSFDERPRDRRVHPA